MTSRSLARQVACRLAIWAGLLAASGLLAAALVRLAPGFDADDRLLDARLAPESREAIVRERAAHSDVLAYYTDYLGRLARGDLGRSVSLGRPVNELLRERLPGSVGSALAGLGLAWAVSLAAVAVLEFRPSRWLERPAAVTAAALLCVPAAVSALACVYLGAAAPTALAIVLLPRIFRYTRNVAAAARRAPHVLAATGCGLRPGRILSYHVIAPAWPELAALGGVSVSMAAGALIPVESLCGSPGVGQLVWQAALSRDLPVLVNVTLLITAFTTGANLLSDGARAVRES